VPTIFLNHLREISALRAPGLVAIFATKLLPAVLQRELEVIHYSGDIEEIMLLTSTVVKLDQASNEVWAKDPAV
jgi:hypothetical protein